MAFDPNPKPLGMRSQVREAEPDLDNRELPFETEGTFSDGDGERLPLKADTNILELMSHQPSFYNPSDIAGLYNANWHNDGPDGTLADLLATPSNFAVVMPGLFRSSFPQDENINFLKMMGLKSIVTLVDKEYTEVGKGYIEQHDIAHFQVPMPGNKDSAMNVRYEDIITVLRIVLDRRNHPLLIHCNQGRHRTGCVVGCIRKIQNWAAAKIVNEYRTRADPKPRRVDEEFIELFNEDILKAVAQEAGFIPEEPPILLPLRFGDTGPYLTTRTHRRGILVGS